MEPTDEMSKEEISDAMGEVTNMIMGSIKSRIQDSIGNLEVSIPSAVSVRKSKTAWVTEQAKYRYKSISKMNIRQSFRCYTEKVPNSF